MKNKYLLILLTLIGFGSAAQDPQFSQFYAAPLYQNPAFAGSAFAPRLVVNYRNQWPSINANYNTMAFSLDHYLSKFNSGIGIMFLKDSQGSGVLKSTDVSALYSYQVRLGEESSLRLGVQGTYATRSLNFNDLTFGDQYDNNGLTSKPTDDPIVANLIGPDNFYDFSAGALFYNSRMWLGTSVHHLGKPEIKLSNIATGSTTNNLPMKINISGGFNIPLGNPYSNAANADKEFSFSPTFLYKRQGAFDQLDLGFYLNYTPITVGLWYRGIPIKKRNISATNHDALVFLAGLRLDNFSFGYSYDLTISSLGLSTGGSHEVSISYQLDPFDNDSPRNRRRRYKTLSCPKF
jgi:type IX secretion system PorP/SprF family membrane protein